MVTPEVNVNMEFHYAIFGTHLATVLSAINCVFTVPVCPESLDFW